MKLVHDLCAIVKIASVDDKVCTVDQLNKVNIVNTID